MAGWGGGWQSEDQNTDRSVDRLLRRIQRGQSLHWTIFECLVLSWCYHFGRWEGTVAYLAQVSLWGLALMVILASGSAEAWTPHFLSDKT